MKNKFIGLDNLIIYKKYNGEYCELTDHRNGGWRDAKKITEKEWNIIDELEDNFVMLNTGKYSDKMEEEMKRKISKNKVFVTEEVFRSLALGNNKEEQKPTKKKWFNIFKK